MAWIYAPLRFNSRQRQMSRSLLSSGANPQQIAEDYNSLQGKIPSEFWAELNSKL